MSKAFFISLLLHVLLFIMMIFLIPQELVKEHYPVLAISFFKSEVREKELVREKTVVPIVPDTIESFEETKPEVEELPLMADSTDTETDISDKISFQESPEVEQNGQDEMIENNSVGPESVDNNIAAENYPLSGSSEPEMEIPSSLDIRWADGKTRKLLRGDKPSLDISRNSILMDQVRISFSVYPDGTVYNVLIAPPGSNSFKVDRQLREWVSLLFFEALQRDENSTEGLLLVNLTVREIP